MRWLVLCSGMAPTFVDRDNHRTTHVLSLSLSLSARTMIERKWCGITSNLPLFRRNADLLYFAPLKFSGNTIDLLTYAENVTIPVAEM
eukprot:COSAG01_NODE_4168_length_5274_cov_1.998261_5_plen_88_part_00